MPDFFCGDIQKCLEIQKKPIQIQYDFLPLQCVSVYIFSLRGFFFFFFQTRCLCYIIDNDGFLCGFRFCHFCSCNALNFQCHRIVCMEISITTVAGCRQWKQKGWNRSSYDTAAQFSLELHTYWAIPHLTIWAGVEFHCRMHAKCKRDRE